MSDDLFLRAAAGDPNLTPLADRLRPRDVTEIVGQEHLLGPGRFLRQAIQNDRVPSLILWGPPGTGKTTLARVLAHHTAAKFVPFSAVSGTLKDVRAIIERAREERSAYHRKTILFIDEIHRFNKAQQDALLPSAESGVITLIGATTENPSFSVISALLSRSKVLRLEPLAAEEIEVLLRRALSDAKQGLGGFGVDAEDTALRAIAENARGDARFALNSLEIAVHFSADRDLKTIDRECVQEAMQSKSLLYDKTGEEHYNVISAFIKSLRGSDPDAALYWMFRMLDAGKIPSSF